MTHTGKVTQVIGAVVDVQFDGLLQTPRFIHDRDGFLTGPGGQGRAVTKPSAALASDPHAPIKSFITEHSDLFGFDAHRVFVRFYFAACPIYIHLGELSTEQQDLR